MKKLDLFVVGLWTFCAAFFATLDWSVLLRQSSAEYAGLATFVGLAVVAQILAVDSTVGGAKPVKSSIAFLPLLAAAVLFPPPAVIIATAAMTAFTEIFFRERIWNRVAFNTAQTALAYGLGSRIYQGLAGFLGAELPLGTSGEFTDLFLCFYGLAATFFATNLILVSAYVALRQGEKFGTILAEATGRGGGNLFYDLLASPVALFAAYLYAEFRVGGLLAVVLPLLLIRYSYLSAIDLQRANRDLLRVLIKAIETRDPYTSGHSMRVSNLARMISEDHGLRVSVATNIETAALLHDIGKIDALYAEIISKKAELTNDERAVIRTHATKGADLLQTLTSLDRDIIVGVRHHHERYDGKGYPSGLRGKEIPLAARIIMLCDSIDAMLSDRPYRKALPIAEVHEELKRCAGFQFDPDLVDTILRNSTLERAELLVDRSGARAPSRIPAAAAS